MTRFLDLNSSFIAVNDGQFDSRDRFVRKVANSADATMTMVTTVSLSATRKSGTETVSWRWQCGPVTFHGRSTSNGTQIEPNIDNGPTDLAL